MNKNNLSLLGLDENATRQDIEEAYKTLVAKYKEDRFLDGEAGNEAARMLTKVETAYRELINELDEETVGDTGVSFEKVEELLKNGDIHEAQRVLDAFNERGAYWHYLQSVIFYRKNWVNESKKQLEIAMRLEPDNEKYKTAYKKLTEKTTVENLNYAGTGNGEDSGVYRAQNMDSYSDGQMGGNFCNTFCQCLALNCCINCLCNSCCH